MALLYQRSKFELYNLETIFNLEKARIYDKDNLDHGISRVTMILKRY